MTRVTALALVALAGLAACSSATAPAGTSNACSNEETVTVGQYTQQYGQPTETSHIATADTYVFDTGTDAITHAPITTTLSFDWSSGACVVEANGQPLR